MALPFRAKQLIVSLVGALLFVPVDLFLGGAFAFSFGAQSSLGAWAFDLAAFWGQILGILVSFFKPRLGGVCILASVTASVAIRLSMHVEAVYGPVHWGAALWLNAAPGLLKTAGLFWAASLVMALLLLRPAPAIEREPIADSQC